MSLISLALPPLVSEFVVLVLVQLMANYIIHVYNQIVYQIYAPVSLILILSQYRP